MSAQESQPRKKEPSPSGTASPHSSIASSSDSYFELPPCLVDHVDAQIFRQIIEMDDPSDQDRFSEVLVYDFLDQAKGIFRDITQALEGKELARLSDLGHYLKGSSAAIGLSKVRDYCENIQRFGSHQNPDGSALLDDQVCLDKISENLKVLRVEFEKVKEAMCEYYSWDNARMVDLNSSPA